MPSSVIWDIDSLDAFRKAQTARKQHRIILLLLTLFISYTSCFSSFLIVQSEISMDMNNISYENSHWSDSTSHALTTEDPRQLSTLITKTDEAFVGYNLFGLFQANPADITLKNRSLLVTNMEGEVITRYGNVSFPQDVWVSHCAKFINSTTILFGSGKGATLWNVYDNTTVYLGFSGHHEFEYNPLNNTFFTFNQYTVKIDKDQYLFDKIEEYDTTGHLVWSLDTRSFINHSQWCPFQDMLYGARDIPHSNSLFFDTNEDVLYYNARNVNTFYKINHKTKQVLWGLGEYGNFTLFDQQGDLRETLFYHAHAVEKVDENTFILFDNDLHNQSNPMDPRSRLVEITINETTMTANVSWAWTAPIDYYSGGYGDADRLPNGNRLGTFGSEWHPNSTIGAKLVEVNEAGQIVWELNFPNTENTLYSVYRVERFRLTPILSSPPNIQVIPTEDVVASWQTWYNFRTNRQVQGSYKLYLDGIQIKNGSHIFERFWRPTNLTFNLGSLEAGGYNLTLILADEAGHSTKDSLVISSTAFYIDREGPLATERGQENALLQWKGNTSRPLLATLTINQTQVSSFIWNGSLITLDLNALETGTHLVILQLLVDPTQPIYEDRVVVATYPEATPILHSIPVAQSITWNESLILTWEFFDHLPAFWTIFINQMLIDTGSWETPHYRLNWSVPLLDEGLYNITLVIYDHAGHWRSGTTWLTVIPPTPPVIVAIPSQTEIQWGQDPIFLSWEVHGGTSWMLWKNQTMAYSGEITSTRIEIRVANWKHESWRPGMYNLTLQVGDERNAVTTRTSWLRLWANLGDAYADSILPLDSLWYSFGEHTLGPPDDNFAIITVDYGEGYLTIDMGRGEEIVDGNGMDFTVIAQGGSFTVWASSSRDHPFTQLGVGSGNQSFDLGTVTMPSARYVRIQHHKGDDVQLDAIVAINYIEGARDNDPPQISGPKDFWIWETQATISLTWRIFDATPWNYSILINGAPADSGEWDGTDITFEFSWTRIGKVHVTLILYDFFGNQATNTVTIIRALPSTIPFIVLVTLLGSGIALAVIRYLKQQRN